MLKKILEFLKEKKGQGIVEYALILGFVAIIAVYVMNGSSLKDSVKTNIENVNKVATLMNDQFNSAGGSAITTKEEESSKE